MKISGCAFFGHLHAFLLPTFNPQHFLHSCFTISYVFLNIPTIFSWLDLELHRQSLKKSSPYRESPLLLLQNPQKKIKIGTLLSVATAPEKQQLYQKSKKMRLHKPRSRTRLKNLNLNKPQQRTKGVRRKRRKKLL